MRTIALVRLGHAAAPPPPHEPASTPAHLPATAEAGDAAPTCAAAAAATAAADCLDEAGGTGQHEERGGERHEERGGEGQGGRATSSRAVGLLQAFFQYYEGIGTARCSKVVLAPGAAVRSEGMLVLDYVLYMCVLCVCVCVCVGGKGGDAEGHRGSIY